jgi:hypothetical protein
MATYAHTNTHTHIHTRKHNILCGWIDSRDTLNKFTWMLCGKNVQWYKHKLFIVPVRRNNHGKLKHNMNEYYKKYCIVMKLHFEYYQMSDLN